MQTSDTFPAGMRLILFVVLNAWVINMIVFTTFDHYSGRLYQAVKGRELTRFALLNLAQLGMLLLSAYLAYRLFHSNGLRALAWGLAVLVTLIVQGAILSLGEFCDEWTRWRSGTQEGVGFVRDRLAERLRKRLGSTDFLVGIGGTREASHYSLFVQVPTDPLTEKIPKWVEGVPVFVSVSTE